MMIYKESVCAVGSIEALIQNEPLPKMLRVAQLFDNSSLNNVPIALEKQLARSEISDTIRPGMSVAVAVGSRGIDHLEEVVKTVVDYVLKQGAKAFIVPAMGSHGGSTAEGQHAILAGYRIDEEHMGVPVKSSMETVILGNRSDGTPVFFDKNAIQADGVILINRVKLHTGFRGRYESGLMKLMTIGLGKQKGTEALHRDGLPKLPFYIEDAGQVILSKANILFGVALVENAYDHTCCIEAITKDEIPLREPELLNISRERMPKILFQNLDLLVVDRIGKNISGIGMDPNVTYTFLESTGLSREGRAKRVVVLDLTDESHGSAAGIGLADTTTKRLFQKMDFDNTYPNS